MARIGLDITMLAERRTGVENYVKFLAEHLPNADPGIEMVFFSAKPLHEKFRAEAVTSSHAISYARWRQQKLPELLTKHGIDLLHSPVAAFPLGWKGRLVATIHDLTWMVFPRGYPLRRRLAHRLWCHLAVRCADRIITPSRATAGLLAQLTPSMPPDKVKVIPECVNATRYVSKANSDAGDLLHRLQITKPFLLAVGTLRPHKNYERLIGAFERMNERGGQIHQLVIVGGDGYGAADIRKAAARSAQAANIRLVGYLDDDGLTALYQAASVFVFPSLSEGFGLPLIEAMAVSTPVAASRASAMEEVGGDAACYFDPRNVEQMAETILRVLTDKHLRKDLAWKGRERVRLFTPERMVADTAALYRKTLGDGQDRDSTL